MQDSAPRADQHAGPLVHPAPYTAISARKWQLAGSLVTSASAVRICCLRQRTHRPEAEIQQGGRTRAAMRDELIRQVHEHFRGPDFTRPDAGETQPPLGALGPDPVRRSGPHSGNEIRRARPEFTRRLLERGAAVRAAGYDSGFNDAGIFARAFRGHFGHSPALFLRALV